MAAGDLLLKAKQQVGHHGQWTEWIKRSCKISDRTARLYMQLAQNREAIAKRQRVADLTLREAVKAIAAPKANGASPLPKAAHPVNGFEPKKRSTRHDLMAVWLNTPAEDRLHFMADVGLMWRRDAGVHAPTPPALPIAISDWRPVP